MYGEEEVSDEDENAAAEIDMHVVPVKLWLEQNAEANKAYWLKISGLPSFYTKEKAIKMLEKQVPTINKSELTFEKTQGKSARHSRWENGTVWVNTSCRQT